MADGLPSALGDLTSASLEADSVVTSTISGLSVTEAKLGAASVGAAKQGFLGTGSPTGFGASAQYGAVTASNAAVWTSFGTAFAAAPQVYLTLNASGADKGYVATIDNGSFSMLGESGISYAWLAIGSGDI